MSSAALVEKIIQEGGLLLIERELGAPNGLSFIEKKLKGYKIYKASASDKVDNIFGIAMPDYSNLFRFRRPPKVLALYFINLDGMLLTDVHRQETDLDPDIFSSMLLAVNNFVKDSITQWSEDESDSAGGLNILSYEDEKLGNITIHISRGDSAVLVATYSGNVSDIVEDDLEEKNEKIHEKFSGLIREWQGNKKDKYVHEIEGCLKDRFLSSDKYDGEIDQKKMKEARKNIRSRLLTLIKEESKENKIAFLFDQIQDIDPFSVDMLLEVAEETNVPIFCQYDLDRASKQKVDDLILRVKELDKAYTTKVKSKIDVESYAKSIIQKVSDEHMQLLFYAAILNEFNVKILENFTDRTRKELISILKQLREIGIFRTSKFANTIIKEKVEDMIPSDEREDMDMKVIDYLISSEDEHPIKIATLLDKYSERNDYFREKTVEYSIMAAEKYLETLDTDKALEFYNKALALDTNDQRKMKILEETLVIESITWKD